MPEPSTLEAQVVRFADRIAYINHDIDDALRAGLITADDLPSDPLAMLGDTGSRRVDTLVHDLVDTSYETGAIVQSPAIAKAMLDLRDFMFQTVYPQSLERAGEERVRHVITNLMNYFMEHPEEMGDGPDFGSFAGRTIPEPAAGALECIQAVTDYISGMTDRYAISRYRALFEPRSWAAP
jgi:dGTPase